MVSECRNRRIGCVSDDVNASAAIIDREVSKLSDRFSNRVQQIS